MNDFSDKDLYSRSDKNLSELMGAFIKHHRISQNLTQSEVAKSARMSRSTLSLLESGEPVSVTTLIKVLRVLNLLHIMEVFKVTQKISPLALAKAEQSKRQRVKSKPKKEDPTEEW